MEKDEFEMSEREKALADHVAKVVLDRLISAIESDELSDRIISTWGGNFDRIIGRALRRLGLYVVLGLIVIGTTKLELWGKFWAFLKT